MHTLNGGHDIAIYIYNIQTHQDIVNLGTRFTSAQVPNAAIVKAHTRGEYSPSYYRKVRKIGLWVVISCEREEIFFIVAAANLTIPHSCNTDIPQMQIINSEDCVIVDHTRGINGNTSPKTLALLRAVCYSC